MMYFALPNFYETAHAQNFIYEITKINPHYLKEPVSFYSVTGTFPYSSWNGGLNSNLGKGAYYKDFLDFQNENLHILPLRFNVANVLLEDYDYYDAMNQAILKIFHDGSTELEISSIPLMEKIQAEYPYYRFFFSKNADLITPFTPELLNQIVESDNFTMVGIPDKYNSDDSFLSQLKKKNKYEITVNPICPKGCADCDKCLLNEHIHQIEYSNRQDMMNCTYKNEFLNQSKFPTLEELKKNYVSKGFNHFTFSPQYILSQNDIVDFYIQYFIKPEYAAKCYSEWTNRGGV